MLLEMHVKLKRGNFVLNTQLEIGDINTGLLGKAGAGKSTLLSLIAGTIQPQSGRIILDGKPLFDSRTGIMVPRERRPVSAVFQSGITASRQTVKEALDAAFNRTLAPRRLKVEFLIEMLELETVLNCPIIKLSVQARKRVALARLVEIAAPACCWMKPSQRSAKHTAPNCCLF